MYNTAAGRNWAAPLNTIRQTSPFGPRWGRLHAGVDLDLDTGDPIYSAFDGIVRVSNYNAGGYGNYVVVRHYNGFETLYGHMSARGAEPGTIVKSVWEEAQVAVVDLTCTLKPGMKGIQ